MTWQDLVKAATDPWGPDVQCPLCHGVPGHPVRNQYEGELALIPVSQNKLAAPKGGGGNQWWRYKKFFDLCLAHIVEWKQAAQVKEATVRRRIVVTRLFAGREQPFDHANFVGGMKPFMDALIKARLLVDDSPSWLEAYYQQVRCGRRGLRLLVQDLDTRRDR